MQQFELDYANLVAKIAHNGQTVTTRNGRTLSIFGEQLKIDMTDQTTFPLLRGRQIFYKGVLGEFAALVRKPKHVDDFKAWGCNYWDLWADKEGNLEVDYGNAWFDDGQIDKLKDSLRNNPADRRMIINGWRADRLDKLSLPCCHYAYQFNVSADGYLNMVWIQRSVDTMIGLPSDIVLAATWLISLAHEFGYKTGVITMQLGDCHIYEEHLLSGAVEKYLNNVHMYRSTTNAAKYTYKTLQSARFEDFEPSNLVITNYYPCEAIKLELKQ